LQKHITIKSLALLVFKAGKKDTLRNPDRALRVLKIINVMKKLSISSMEKLSTLLFGYLSGKRYESSERSSLWNVNELEQELFRLQEA